MPITQDRIQALISAAEDFQQAMEYCRSVIKSAWENYKIEKMDPGDQLERVHNLIEPNAMLLNRSDSAAIIATEKKWFKRFGKVNERRMKKRRAQRERGFPMEGRKMDNALEIENLQHALKVGLITREKYDSMFLNGKYIGPPPEISTTYEPTEVELVVERAKQISADEDAEDERRRTAMREEYERMKAAKEADGAGEGSAGCDKSSQGGLCHNFATIRADTTLAGESMPELQGSQRND